MRRLGGGELGHGLGALRDGVLGQLSGEDQAHGGLDLAGGEGGLLVDASELKVGIEKEGEHIRKRRAVLLNFLPAGNVS